MPKIWSAKNLGEGPAQIFGRSNFWELRYLYGLDHCGNSDPCTFMCAARAKF